MFMDHKLLLMGRADGPSSLFDTVATLDTCSIGVPIIFYLHMN
jgi:hypothetical protein